MPEVDLSCMPCCEGAAPCCCEELCVDGGMLGLLCPDLTLTVANVSLCSRCFPDVITLVYNNATECWEGDGGCGFGNDATLCCDPETCIWTLSMCNGALVGTGLATSCDPLMIDFGNICNDSGTATCCEAGPGDDGCVSAIVTL